MLAEQLDMAAAIYSEYKKKGIPEEIFIRTMAFCTRFTEEHHRLYGEYAYTWGWWFVRQLAMQEFRIGELEFEFVTEEL